MKLKITIYGIIISLLFCNASPLVAQQVQDFFPLSEGTYWVYKGTVKWTESVNKVKKRSIIWKMEVIKRLKNGPYEIALMKGHPKDLCWYEPDQKPTDYLIVWKDQKYYLIRIDNDFNKLIADAAYLSGKADFNNLFLVEPLKQGLEFGMEPDDERTDHRYRWYVDSEESIKFYKVAGIKKEKAVSRFTLLYRTNPDHEIVHFVPSIGITKFIYVHHGTVSEADVSLVEFHQK